MSGRRYLSKLSDHFRPWRRWLLVSSKSDKLNQPPFVDWSPDPNDQVALLERLIASNSARVGPGGFQKLTIVLRDPETGGVSSGASGYILYGWLFIDILFVAEFDRKHGLGSRLLKQLETAARKHKCVGAWLNTYAFQAPDFYEKNGYERFAELVRGANTTSQELYFYRKLFE